MRPDRIDACWQISIVENAMPTMSPVYFTRSPKSILSAYIYMKAIYLLSDIDDTVFLVEFNFLNKTILFSSSDMLLYSR